MTVVLDIDNVRVLSSRAAPDHFLDRCRLAIFHEAIFHHVGAFGSADHRAGQKANGARHETTEDGSDDHRIAHTTSKPTVTRKAAEVMKLGIDLLPIGKRAGSV